MSECARTKLFFLCLYIYSRKKLFVDFYSDTWTSIESLVPLARVWEYEPIYRRASAIL